MAQGNPEGELRITGPSFSFPPISCLLQLPASNRSQKAMESVVVAHTDQQRWANSRGETCAKWTLRHKSKLSNRSTKQYLKLVHDLSHDELKSSLLPLTTSSFYKFGDCRLSVKPQLAFSKKGESRQLFKRGFWISISDVCEK